MVNFCLFPPWNIYPGPSVLCLPLLNSKISLGEEASFCYQGIFARNHSCSLLRRDVNSFKNDMVEIKPAVTGEHGKKPIFLKALNEHQVERIRRGSAVDQVVRRRHYYEREQVGEELLRLRCEAGPVGLRASLQPAHDRVREGPRQEGPRLQRGGRQGLAEGQHGHLRQDHLPQGPGQRPGHAQRRYERGLLLAVGIQLGRNCVRGVKLLVEIILQSTYHFPHMM